MDSFDYIDDIPRRLTLEEKVRLLAAKDWWRTAVIETGWHLCSLRKDQFAPASNEMVANNYLISQ